MSDRVDPGPGWRLLKVGGRKPRGYEYKNPVFGWIKGDGVGRRALAGGFPCRIRIASRTTKAIATRATVRAAFLDGAMIADSIACAELRYRAQRRADRIAAQMRTGRELRGVR